MFAQAGPAGWGIAVWVWKGSCVCWAAFAHWQGLLLESENAVRKITALLLILGQGLLVSVLEPFAAEGDFVLSV